MENTVEKEEIAHYEQFLLFPQCFQKACFPGASKGVIVWEWVKTHTASKLDVVQIMIFGFQKFEITEGKVNNTGYQHFPKMFFF